MSAVPTATRNAQTRHYPSRRGNVGASLSAPQLTNGYRRIRLLCVRGAETAASRRHRGRATARIELGVDVADVGVDRVDGDVERKRDLGSCEVRRQVAQDAKLAWAEFLRLRQGAAVGARGLRALQPVDDVGEEGGFPERDCRFVAIPALSTTLPLTAQSRTAIKRASRPKQGRRRTTTTSLLLANLGSRVRGAPYRDGERGWCAWSRSRCPECRHWDRPLGGGPDDESTRRRLARFPRNGGPACRSTDARLVANAGAA